MSTASGHGSVMWQGYVAAIACLAQAMLFLLAILTVAITQIAGQIDFDERGRIATAEPAPASRLQREDRMTEAAEPLAETRAAPALPALPPRASGEPAPGRKPVASSTIATEPTPAAASAVPAQPQGTTRRGQFQIVFPRDAQTIPSGQQAPLATQFAEMARNRAGRWHVWTRVPLDEPALKRSAYLRLLAVRSALMGSGAAASDIDVQMLDGGDAEELAREMAIHVDRTGVAPPTTTTTTTTPAMTSGAPR